MLRVRLTFTPVRKRFFTMTAACPADTPPSVLGAGMGRMVPGWRSEP